MGSAAWGFHHRPQTREHGRRPLSELWPPSQAGWEAVTNSDSHSRPTLRQLGRAATSRIREPAEGERLVSVPLTVLRELSERNHTFRI